MRKTTICVNSNTQLTVKHPDWSNEQLIAKLRNSIKDVKSIKIVQDNVEDFPDIEYNENGQRCLSLADLL